MAETLTDTGSSDKPFGISQIRAYIPVTLSLDKLNYDVWRELFETHCLTFSVIGHLDGTTVSTPETAKQWKEHDGLVKMWIYGTITDSLLDTVIKARCTARELWLSLENLFRDNKEARALQFDNELRTITIGDLSVSEYCRKIKTLSDLLANVDSPVPDRNLVMHMLNGLTDKYDSILNVIKHRSPFPTFTDARSMLLSEETRLQKHVKPSAQHSAHASSPDVLFTASTHQQRPPNNNYDNNSRRYVDRSSQHVESARRYLRCQRQREFENQ